MSVLKGLKDFKKEKQRQQEQREARERPKIEYFNWKNNKNKDDPNVVLVQFLQEFDEAIDGYRPEFGLPVSAVEHQAPGKQGYLRRASCSLEDEGRCYACERHAEDRAEMKLTGRKEPKGWGQKRNFYIWVQVDYKDGEGPQPVVISRSFNSSFVDDLVLEVEDPDNDNKITDKVYRITRTGSGKSTAWKLRLAKGVEVFDTTDLELPDLEEAVLRKIPYDQQAEYFGQVYKEGDPLDNDGGEESAPAKNRQVTGELTW